MRVGQMRVDQVKHLIRNRGENSLRVEFRFVSFRGSLLSDLDGDDRPDLFFVSGPGRNHLYRQVGDFAFEEVTGEEVTERAGIDGGEKWGAGAWGQEVGIEA